MTTDPGAEDLAVSGAEFAAIHEVRGPALCTLCPSATFSLFRAAPACVAPRPGAPSHARRAAAAGLRPGIVAARRDDEHGVPRCARARHRDPPVGLKVLCAYYLKYFLVLWLAFDSRKGARVYVYTTGIEPAYGSRGS